MPQRGGDSTSRALAPPCIYGLNWVFCVVLTWRFACSRVVPEVDVLETRDRDETVESGRGLKEGPRGAPRRPDEPGPSDSVLARSSHDGVSGDRSSWRFPVALKTVLAVGALALIVGVASFLFLRPVAVTVAAVTTRDLAPAIQGVGTVEAGERKLATPTMRASAPSTARTVFSATGKRQLDQSPEPVKSGPEPSRWDRAHPAAEQAASALPSGLVRSPRLVLYGPGL